MTLRLRRILPPVAAVTVVAAATGLWWSSLMPGTYSVMEMGYAVSGSAQQLTHHGSGLPDAARAGGDSGDGAAGGAGVGAGRASALSVAQLTGDRDRPADVSYVLTVREERTRLADGTMVDGLTVNGSTPGPLIEATVGDLVEVVLVNDNVTEGVTLHWHGIDVPNAEDGVAGVTQDAVRTGATHTYRFTAEDPGTYWYHSHQVSHRQVVRGLLGAVVIAPAQPVADVETVAVLHRYAGRATVNGRAGESFVAAAPGDTARVRLVNTDDGPTSVWVSGGNYRVVAVDGRDLHGPTPVRDERVLLTAGGRVDLEVIVPVGGVRVQSPGVALVVGPPGAAPPESSAPTQVVDLLSYGSPGGPRLDPDTADRRFDYQIGRRFGLLNGRPGLWWTINGGIFPDVPMFHVREGDLVVMTIRNDSGEVHPMHLHGHHALVLSRNGIPSTGSEWWVDSLNVANKETYEIAFRADNPGFWMDHCHNLPHAREGLMTHLMYEGVTTPYLVGSESGNEPE